MTQYATITASDLQRSSGSVLKRVAVGREHLVIERGGYPVAVILSYQEYEGLMRERALNAHRELVKTLGQEAERHNITEAQLMDDLEGVKQQLFEEIYGQQGE